MVYKTEFEIHDTLDAISHATCGMAIDIGAKVITVCSITGRTARLISRFRGPTDIIGLTTNERAYRKLALSWGITPVMSEVYESTDVLFYHALKVSRAVMQLEKGDKVITAGGIYGTVKEIKETTLLIEVDGNVTLRIDKNMVVADNSDLQRQ